MIGSADQALVYKVIEPALERGFHLPDRILANDTHRFDQRALVDDELRLGPSNSGTDTVFKSVTMRARRTTTSTTR